MFRPPYFAAERIRDGISRPKETAMIRSIGVGGVQVVNVLSSWRGSDRDLAIGLMGTDLRDRPRPEGLSGLQTTEIEAIGEEGSWWRECRARRE